MLQKELQDKVSVIIPAYNRSNYILEAIQSVLEQKYASIEIIIVDDGSTDDTKDKVLPFVGKEWIRYIYQKNKGRSAARNKGLVAAKGDYITFLDSDDIFEPGKIEIQVDYLRRHPEVGLVHGGYIKFDDSGRDLGYRNPIYFKGDIYPDMLLYWSSLLATPAVMLPKKVIEEIGGFDESLYIGEDLDLWRRIARKYPFGYINQSVARVRVHTGNTSADKTKSTLEFEKYLNKAFEDDSSLSSAFRRKAFSRLYSNQAYMFLDSINHDHIILSRFTALKSIKTDFLNAHGYLAFFSSFIPIRIRKFIIAKFRVLRGWIMQHIG